MKKSKSAETPEPVQEKAKGRKAQEKQAKGKAAKEQPAKEKAVKEKDAKEKPAKAPKEKAAKESAAARTAKEVPGKASKEAKPAKAEEPALSVRIPKSLRKALEERRLELTRELTRLENSYPLLTRGIATEELLFLDPVPELLDAALPLMEEYGYPGMLVFSEGNFPGDPGALSKDAFAQLQKKGWSWCVLCSGSLEPEEWFPHLDSLLEAHGLKRPEAIYFKDGAFLLKWEEPVREEGFTAVIHHGEHSLPLISTDLGEDLWYSGALPWNFDGVKTESRI